MGEGGGVENARSNLVSCKGWGGYRALTGAGLGDSSGCRVDGDRWSRRGVSDSVEQSNTSWAEENPYE
jgi:hypothetical protein